MRTLGWLRLAVLMAGLALLFVPVAHAAPIGNLKQFRVPTANGNPKAITPASDGNLWFTESHVNPPQIENHHIGRITPSGAVTEFLVCQFCFPNDIVQGADGILYFTKSDPALGRITTAGQVLPDVQMPNSLANGNGLASHGDDIWMTAFNTHSLWRYNVVTGDITEFAVPTPGANTFDVVVDTNGGVWFTEADFPGQIGRLDPQTGLVSETPVQGSPRQITVASDDAIWFTERFDNAVGRLDPATNNVTMFPLPAGSGPEGIAAGPSGSVWFTQSVAGNIARMTPDGTLTQGKSVRGSEPFGITVANGTPWYTELSANKIASLALR